MVLLIDVISKITNRQIAMSGDIYVYLDDISPISDEVLVEAETELIMLKQKQELKEKILEAKAYLASTDFKMTIDYYATLTEAEQIELTTLRAEAREFIRVNEGVN